MIRIEIIIEEKDIANGVGRLTTDVKAREMMATDTERAVAAAGLEAIECFSDEAVER